MPVPFGFVPETVVATPSGPRPLVEVAVGEAVWSADAATGTPVVRQVIAVHAESAVDHLVAVEAEGALLRGVTPGTAVWDAFEGMFRGAGSLSVAAELRVFGDDATAVSPVLGVDEHVRPGGTVHHLTLDGPEGAFFADGVLVRHLEAR